MRITRIRVEGLFGTFNHDIPLNLGPDPITVMIGPNGYGKTTVLRMLHQLVGGRYRSLAAYPFDLFGVAFDDGGSLEVTARQSTAPAGDSEDVGTGLGPQLRLSYAGAQGKVSSHTVPPLDHEEARFAARYIDDYLPHLERVDAARWLDPTTERELALDEVLAWWGDLLPPLGERRERRPAWIVDLCRRVPVEFIGAHRLLSHDAATRRGRAAPRRTATYEVTVNAYAREMAGTIERAVAEFAESSQSLERTFPQRLMDRLAQSAGTPEAAESLEERLRALDSKRDLLSELGLLDQDTAAREPKLRPTDTPAEDVLGLYLEDAARKLEYFDRYIPTVRAFTEIINRRFLHKTFRVAREDGFVIRDRSGLPLLPDQLSSGEQNELVLFYHLLFRTSPGCLFLVDEPEISLHVAWQKGYLRDLADALRAADCYALVATHSPQIIHDRWDLTVELGEPADAGPA